MAQSPLLRKGELPTTGGASAGADESPDDLLHLPKGEGLPIDGADDITRHRLTNVILFAGTADTGKTTLLGVLYLLFQSGRFASYSFAGSRTLLGFERRVHSSRIASQLGQPRTERSRVSELLHLRVRKEDRSMPAKDLLLCDLIGEDFREARDSRDGCQRLRVIRRADVFVLLIDGARLSRVDTRQQAKNDAVALLRNILDCEMLGETADIDVVHTKWDRVERDSERVEITAFADHVDDDLQRQFAKRVGSMRFSRVAAQADDGSRELGYGLAPLLERWVERPTGLARRRFRSPPEPSTGSEYDRYSSRLRADGTVKEPS